MGSEDVSSNGTTSGGDDYTDPLTIPANCKRDIPLLQQLYTNVIRVYAINPKGDRTECMQMLNDAGIYVIADLSAPVDGQSINRNTPAWNDDLYTRYTSVIDVMANYTNVLGFFAGNEVSDATNNTAASAFVKAAVRDMKSYIKQKNYRTIGVGYATNDNANIRTDLAAYFNCGNQDDAIDFWGYNIYSWCGKSTYQQSGYADRVKEFSTYNVPSFFAEYGCNTQGTRIFQEVESLYGTEMTEVFSGGIVYMYFQEANEYGEFLSPAIMKDFITDHLCFSGLVSIDGDTASMMPDFTNLQTQLAKVTGVTGVNSASYSPTNSPAACPTDSAWAASSDLPPTPNSQLCSCMEDALTCNIARTVSEDDLGDLFGLVCGLSDTACLGIQANGTTGKYGAYGMCNARQQVGWALNAYYSEQNRAADACDFSGSATLQSAVAPTGSCKTLISQAGSQGTGTVTSAPSGTGGSGSSGSGGGSSSGGASGSGNGVGMGFSTTSITFGYWQVAVYLVCAFGSGAAMILL